MMKIDQVFPGHQAFGYVLQQAFDQLPFVLILRPGRGPLSHQKSHRLSIWESVLPIIEQSFMRLMNEIQNEVFTLKCGVQATPVSVWFSLSSNVAI